MSRSQLEWESFWQREHSLRSLYQRRTATGRDRGTRQLSSTSPPSTACSRTSTTGFSGATEAGRRGHRNQAPAHSSFKTQDFRPQYSPRVPLKKRVCRAGF